MPSWRLMWNAVPPKMGLSTSAVKALVFPYYHGTQIIENEVEEKEVKVSISKIFFIAFCFVCDHQFSFIFCLFFS